VSKGSEEIGKGKGQKREVDFGLRSEKVQKRSEDKIVDGIK